MPEKKYGHCGRKVVFTDAEESRIVSFAKKWRAKRFCTAPYIRTELKLKCSPGTVARCQNRHGYPWRPVLKKLKLKQQITILQHLLRKEKEERKHHMLHMQQMTNPLKLFCLNVCFQ